MTFKLQAVALVLLGCGAGTGLESASAPVGGQHISGDVPSGKNSPDFPGGVPAPESDWGPCMDPAGCDHDTQAKPENDPGAPKTESNVGPESLPEGFWDDVENNPPERPDGPIPPPKK